MSSCKYGIGVSFQRNTGLSKSDSNLSPLEGESPYLTVLRVKSHSAKIIVWRFDGRMALSRRDRLIAARHEVLGRDAERPRPEGRLLWSDLS